MARVISKTPTLRGREADSFQREAERKKNKVADKSEVKRALKIFEAVSRKKNKNFFD